MLNAKIDYLLLIVLWMISSSLMASTSQIQKVDSSSKKVAGVNFKVNIYAGIKRSKLTAKKYLETIKLDSLDNYTVLSKAVEVHQDTRVDHSYVSRKIRYKRSSNMLSILNACQSEDGRLYILEVILRSKDIVKPVIAHVIKQTLKTCKENEAYKAIDQNKAATVDSKKLKPKPISITTKPNKGVKPKLIKAVIYEFGSSLSGGGLLQLNHDIYILFKDGWAYRDPSVPLSDLDVALSKKYETMKWLKLRKKWGTYEVEKVYKAKKVWESIGDPHVLKAQKKGKKYTGYYSYTQASGSAWYGANVSKGAIKFKPDDQYEGWSSSQYGSMNNDVVSVFAHQYCDKSGGRSSVSANSAGASIGSGKDIDCADDKEGTYLVDGFTIEQKTRTGLITRLPFFELPKGSIMIGRQVYRKKTD